MGYRKGEGIYFDGVCHLVTNQYFVTFVAANRWQTILDRRPPGCQRVILPARGLKLQITRKLKIYVSSYTQWCLPIRGGIKGIDFQSSLAQFYHCQQVAVDFLPETYEYAISACRTWDRLFVLVCGGPVRWLP
jgi:hypothetical protein